MLAFAADLKPPRPPAAPRTGAQSYASIVLPLADARKVFLLNRGIWDSIATAGPSVSYALSLIHISEPTRPY